MNSQEVYITANPTPNPECLKFIVDRQLVDGDPLSFHSAEEAADSPLARKLFELGHVAQIFAYQNFITITKTAGVVWQDFAREIGKAIRSHVQSGEAHFAERAGQVAESSDDAIRLIHEVLDEIRPAVAMDGGNIVFAGYHDGVVQVYMQGSCSGCPSSTVTLRAGLESRLREVLPDLREVVALS
jgi:Fe-S cluster biogenesis protein NfuA